jgi:hypothetical protein
LVESWDFKEIQVWLRVGISEGLRFGGNKCISWPLSPDVQCGQWHKGHTKHEGPTNAPRPLSHKHEEVVTKRKRGHRISCIVVGEPRPIRIGGFGMGPTSQLCGFVYAQNFIYFGTTRRLPHRVMPRILNT